MLVSLVVFLCFSVKKCPLHVLVSSKPEIYLNIFPKSSTFLTENIGSITDTTQFILCRELIPVYGVNCKKCINTLWARCRICNAAVCGMCSNHYSLNS